MIKNLLVLSFKSLLARRGKIVRRIFENFSAGGYRGRDRHLAGGGRMADPGPKKAANASAFRTLAEKHEGLFQPLGDPGFGFADDLADLAVGVVGEPEVDQAAGIGVEQVEEVVRDGDKDGIELTGGRLDGGAT